MRRERSTYGELNLETISLRELRHIIEIALEVYKIAYREKWPMKKLAKHYMNDGLCGYLYFKLNLDMYEMMSDELYAYWLKVPAQQRPIQGTVYLGTPPQGAYDVKSRMAALKRRIIFMEVFLKELPKAD